MRMTLTLAAAIIGSAAATAQNSLVDMSRTAASSTPANVTAASGSFLGGGGTCATPTMVPAGPTGANFPYDITVPASGGVATNPFELLCDHGGQLGIDNEEWWSWTATADGTARLKTCAGTPGPDTKIAIYADDCPNMAVLDPISCKDEDPICPANETTIVWDIVNGTSYLIQLGTFATAPGGAGGFSIEQLAARAPGQYDIGPTANAFGPGATGGDVLWMQVFDAGAGEMLNSVDAAFGTPPGAGVVDPDGSPAVVAVYSGEPGTGLTFLQSQNIVTAMSATDTLVNYPLTTPQAVTGIYTVGIMAVGVTGGFFPAPLDYSVNSRGRAWLAWDNTGAAPIDITDPTTAGVGPGEMQTNFVGSNDGVWLLRVNTTPDTSTFTTFCTGDGGNQMGCTDCPCSNNAVVGSGGGCLHSGGTGSRLVADGSTSVSLDPAATNDLRFRMTDGAAFQLYILNSGNALAPGDPANPCFGLGSGAAGAAFDGLRCAIMGTLRNGGRGADANGEVGCTNNSWGGPSNPPGGIAQFFGYTSGSTKFFQCIHRDSTAVNCGTGLNTTQAIQVDFTP